MRPGSDQITLQMLKESTLPWLLETVSEQFVVTYAQGETVSMALTTGLTYAWTVNQSIGHSADVILFTTESLTFWWRCLHPKSGSSWSHWECSIDVILGCTSGDWSYPHLVAIKGSCWVLVGKPEVRFEGKANLSALWFVWSMLSGSASFCAQEVQAENRIGLELIWGERIYC